MLLKQSTLGEILVIGMSRSGTTVVTNILRAANNVHVEMEPHLIWKAGDFNHLDDEDHPRGNEVHKWIHDRLTEQAVGQLLVEKSPPNCLRPLTVHSVFPNARVIYVLREPQACLYSNYVRSSGRAALSPRGAIRKYLMDPSARHVRDTDFEFEREVSVGTPLWKQVRASEARAFLDYSWHLLRLRQGTAILPFGPKLDGFEDLVRDIGLVGYHAECLIKASEKAVSFRKLYGDAMHVIALEDLLRTPDVIVRDMLRFVGCEIAPHKLIPIIAGLKTGGKAKALPLEFVDQLATVMPPQRSARMKANIDAMQ